MSEKSKTTQALELAVRALVLTRSPSAEVTLLKQEALAAINAAIDLAQQPAQGPVATVAEVHMSRYTLEWTNGPMPEGTKLYAATVDPNAGPPYSLDTMDPVLRDLIVCAVHGAITTQQAPPDGHWLYWSWHLGQQMRAAAPVAQGLRSLTSAMAERAELTPEQLDALPRKLLDIACRVRTDEVLFRDDEAIDQAAHVIKGALLAAAGAKP